tara:strand:+ start:283 stop:555 length:273 start_codon:yes stop_codon:yes gene_type:complete
MLVRKCAKGNKVYIFKPRTKENVSYKFSDTETISFDAQNKSYIVVSDGAVVKRSNSWITAQSAFLKESQDDIQKLEVGKHKLVNGVATEV